MSEIQSIDCRGGRIQARDKSGSKADINIAALAKNAQTTKGLETAVNAILAATTVSGEFLTCHIESLSPLVYSVSLQRNALQPNWWLP